MSNNISLTIRLPHELNTHLANISKEVGMTKTSLIRSAIHDFLSNNEYVLDFTSRYTDKNDRLVLNINPLAQSLLEDACKHYNQSMNAIVTAVSILALERSTKWLQALRQ